MQKYIKHIIAIGLFITVALAYFSPVLQGKKIYQNDIAQYAGMGKEIIDYRKANNDEETYWTNRAFGGMPTYQLGARFPNDFIKTLDETIRFLPRPADYLFLAFVSFYILTLVLKIDYKLGILGALAFGLSTYFIIIIGVGHNAKIHAVAYFPLILAGILLAFQKRYTLGFIVTAIAMALEIHANHVQMTYYLLFAILILGLVYLYDAYRKKTIPAFIKTVSFLILAVFFGIGMNATKLLTTKEYKDYSTRSDSELTVDKNGNNIKPQKGLSHDYITEYSYGKLESINLFIPRFMGGANHERLGTDSNMYEFVKPVMRTRSDALDFVRHSPTYWGKQPIVAGPAYIGALVIFLFVFALFIYKGKDKIWITSSIILVLLLSWGKNFSFLTDFFIDHIPLYNIFRAVSSIQVVIEFLVPLFGIMGLSYLIKNKSNLNQKELLKALYYSLGITAGLALFFALFGTSLFDFKGTHDQYYNQFLKPLMQDRKAIFKADSYRSAFLVIAGAIALFLYIKGKLKENILVLALGILVLVDLVGVGRRYVDETNFERASKIEKPFKPNAADIEILKDKGYYRVFDFNGGINSGRASYFHNTIGGYNAAKPRRFQELYDFYIANNNLEMFNMLNIKYFIDDKGAPMINNQANGAAWFVNKLRFVPDANAEILALKDFDSKKEAIIQDKYKGELKNINQVNDSVASIKITSYKPNHLEYQSKSSKAQFAVFSEMYYKNGWKATIDGKSTSIYPVDYVLRGLQIPAGEHQITFRFEPEIVKTGSTITLASTVLFILLAFGLFFAHKKNKI